MPAGISTAEQCPSPATEPECRPDGARLAPAVAPAAPVERAAPPACVNSRRAPRVQSQRRALFLGAEGRPVTGGLSPALECGTAVAQGQSAPGRVCAWGEGTVAGRVKVADATHSETTARPVTASGRRVCLARVWIWTKVGTAEEPVAESPNCRGCVQTLAERCSRSSPVKDTNRRRQKGHFLLVLSCYITLSH